MNRPAATIATEYTFGFHDTRKPTFQSVNGLTVETIDEISRQKKEPAWMHDFRRHALTLFEKKPMPKWGADLSGIKFNELTYYVRPTERSSQNWNDVPADIKNTFDRLGIPEA
jgi:Fe-S cluster assembly protein SufB